MAKNNYTVGRDHNGRTCINIGPISATDKSQVGYIPMADGEGFQLETTSDVSWEQRYKVLPNYPIDKACQLFLNYCTILGASDEVLDALAKIINVTKEDREMATSKFDNPPPTELRGKKKTPVKKKATVKAKASPTKKATTKKAPAKKRATKVPAGEYTSAAKMFQGLIMEGKLTDDEIFAAVQEQFGLDDKKRSYVGWYRNKLKKDGQNPPEAK
jgi:hypothetical protein